MLAPLTGFTQSPGQNSPRSAYMGPGEYVGVNSPGVVIGPGDQILGTVDATGVVGGGPYVTHRLSHGTHGVMSRRNSDVPLLPGYGYTAGGFGYMKEVPGYGYVPDFEKEEQTRAIVNRNWRIFWVCSLSFLTALICMIFIGVVILWSRPHGVPADHLDSNHASSHAAYHVDKHASTHADSTAGNQPLVWHGDVPYTCYYGLASWWKTWNIPKKDWCCRYRGLGCPGDPHTSPPPPPPLPKLGSLPKSEPYDCAAGFQNWEAGWSRGKKKWCCKTKKRGCKPVLQSKEKRMPA